MLNASFTRRLRAVAAFDVAGYSRLMASDEGATHARVNSLFESVVKPQIAACALLLATNSSVQMTAAGTPRRSNSIPSCKLHVEQDPQSPTAVTTASHSRASRSSTTGSATRLALGLLTITTSRS